MAPASMAGRAVRMTWGRLDDQAHEDERFWGLPMAAVGLYYACLSRCLWRDENLVSSVAAQQATYLAHEDPMVAPLLDRGLWVEVPGGWAYDSDDWTAYRCPEEKRQEISEQRSAAGRKGAAARWGARQTDSKAMALPSHEGGKNAPVPVPVPVKALTPNVVKAARPELEVVSRSNPVATYVDAARESNYDPLPEDIKRVGAAAKKAREAGKGAALIEATCERLGRENKGAPLFGRVMADLERGHHGTEANKAAEIAAIKERWG